VPGVRVVQPACSCRVAASPLEPMGGVAGRLRSAECCGEQALDLADGERISPASAGTYLPGYCLYWRLFLIFMSVRAGSPKLAMP
jgi:hypothetical protein